MWRKDFRIFWLSGTLSFVNAMEIEDTCSRILFRLPMIPCDRVQPTKTTEDAVLGGDRRRVYCYRTVVQAAVYCT